MAFGDTDIPYLFADMGVTVVMGAYSTKGFIDTADELVTEGGAPGAIGKMIAVTIKTGSLSGLAVGSIITVDGTYYTVRERLQIDDGTLTRILCAI